MVNPVNGSGTQQQIANPFQQRQANNDDKQAQDAGKAAKAQQASYALHQNSGKQTEQARQVAQNNNESKPHQNAGRGRIVDITA